LLIHSGSTGTSVSITSTAGSAGTATVLSPGFTTSGHIGKLNAEQSILTSVRQLISGKAAEDNIFQNKLPDSCDYSFYAIKM
jgi:hypothetical protein